MIRRISNTIWMIYNLTTNYRIISNWSCLHKFLGGVWTELCHPVYTLCKDYIYIYILKECCKRNNIDYDFMFSTAGYKSAFNEGYHKKTPENICYKDTLAFRNERRYLLCHKQKEYFEYCRQVWRSSERPREQTFNMDLSHGRYVNKLAWLSRFSSLALTFPSACHLPV